LDPDPYPDPNWPPSGSSGSGSGSVKNEYGSETLASMKTIAAKQKKNAKLILHIILELVNKFGLTIDKNILKEMTFSKAIKILQSILKKTYSRSSVTVKTC
jgi:hypothetical protein